jgi:hypothetical protein
MRNALAHAGESSRRAVSAFMATAFAQDGAAAAESARHRLPSGAVAGDRAPPGDGRPRILLSAMVLFQGRFRGVHRASANAGHSPTAKGSAGDLVGSTMDVEEMVILRVSSRVEYEPSPLLALPAADEGPRGIGELHRCVRRADGVDGVLGCNDESSSFGERLRENMEVAHTRRGREAAMLSSPDDPRDPAALGAHAETHDTEELSAPACCILWSESSLFVRTATGWRLDPREASLA